MRGKEKMIVFGDLHLNWQAAQLILGYARMAGINKAINLGDEAHKFYPLEAGEQWEYDRLFGELREFRDEAPERVLVCVLGDKTAGVPRDLWTNYVGVNAKGKIIAPSIYHEKNIIAVHHGEWLVKEHKQLITDYNGYEPLVIFHGSSHSMGVLPKYKWLAVDEFVDFLAEGEKKYKLKQKKVYWVNPGGNFIRDDEGRNVANMAIYDPEKQEVILKTIFFKLNLALSPSLW